MKVWGIRLSMVLAWAGAIFLLNEIGGDGNAPLWAAAAATVVLGYGLGTWWGLLTPFAVLVVLVVIGAIVGHHDACPACGEHDDIGQASSVFVAFLFGFLIDVGIFLGVAVRKLVRRRQAQAAAPAA